MSVDAIIQRSGLAAAAATRPQGPLIDLHSAIVVPALLEETFAFFADARNLERLTPPWLSFSIRTPPPIVMRQGLEIDYRIVIHGVPVPWRSRIDIWEPGVRFVDRQIVGPYTWWRHEHGFAAVDGGTRVTDHVEFQPRLRWLTSGMVRRDVGRIFAFRRAELARLFAR